MENKKIIDDKYIIEKRVGSGGEGVAYLVKDIDNKDTTLKVAKVLEFELDQNEIEYELDEEKEKAINHAIDIFTKISLMNPYSPYIIRCFFQKKGKITKNNQLIKNRNYFIFEYAPKGDLWKIINLGGTFEEKYAKIIFQKILYGVQALHNSGIYHLDLKLENIVLDNNYNPKICDFGLATTNTGILTYKVGTEKYQPPQMNENPIKYTGEKADIFSLGCLLFGLVANQPSFDRAEKYDEKYKYIINNKQKIFLKKLGAKNKKVNSLKPEFINLYIKMISYEEKDRPTIEEILKDEWFNEIKEDGERKKL